MDRAIGSERRPFEGEACVSATIAVRWFSASGGCDPWEVEKNAFGKSAFRHFSPQAVRLARGRFFRVQPRSGAPAH